MTSKPTIRPTSPTARRAAEMVAKHPGKTTLELAELIGWSARHTVKALTASRHGGVVGLVRIGGSCWWPADMVAEQTRKLSAAKRERDLRLQRERNLRDKERKAGRIADAAGVRGLSDRPHVTHAHVSSPLPFVICAPRSVFHMGATA